ncbi:hypothetical protein MMC22_010990 [Lobaria immixta]|nr:hypothetical protein [Lobaria immixta]
MQPVSSPVEHLPAIDVSEIDSRTGDQILEAASKWGFLYIRNHGFTAEVLERAFDLSRQFFKSPREEKQKCAIGPDDKGWSAPYSEVLDPEIQQQGDFKEAINFGEFVDGKAQQPLAKSLVAHESELSGFADRCHDLCIRLLQLFAIGLKVRDEDGGKDWFSSRHDPSKGPSGTILRLLYYPALKESGSESIENAKEVVRAAAHTDFGALTLLFQRPSQPGLEIQTPSSTWAPVAVYPPGTEGDAVPPIVVNIGDLLSYWTAGVLKSTMHRVCIPKKNREDRYSIAFFCHPVATTELTPIPSPLVSASENDARKPGENKKAQVLTAAEHLRRRLAATYGWDT